MHVEFRPERFDAPPVRTLDAEIYAEYVARYGEGDATTLGVADFLPPNGAFFVGYADGEPVACGGWRTHDVDAEMKRVYVASSVRGLGLAKRIVGLLEEDARGAGKRRMILESGTGQPEALALYAALGYGAVTPFGHYAGYPNARHLGKDLLPDHAGELSSAE